MNSKRVFILGPSHHVRLGGCALSPAKIYKTPLYDLNIDQKSENFSQTFSLLP
jgi:AmmeMemoRadiSam system protein B